MMLIDSIPALRAMVERYRPTGPKAHLILIGHLLPTAIEYVKLLARRFRVHLIGIPYSSTEEVTSTLEAMGFGVMIPRDIDQIAITAMKLIEHIAQDGRPLVVQEVGGYLASHAAELGQYPNFLGVVEDTHDGHWRHGDTLTYPVVSIARSPIKAIVDGRIGDAAIYSVERILREDLRNVISGTRSLVLGFGRIGSACASALRRHRSDTAVFDVDAIRMMNAHMKGYRTGAIQDLLAQADIVIGASGRCAIPADLLPAIKCGAVLASASTRQVELDLDAMKRDCIVERMSQLVDRYVLEDRFFYVLADGCPINFRDDSILGHALDALYTELFVCLREVAERRVDPGPRDSWPALHHEVARTWCDLHAALISARP